MTTFFRRGRAVRNTLCLVTAAAVTQSVQLMADIFGTGGNQFEIVFVPVGNPGNAADTSPAGWGAVPYRYRVGAYEVSRDMITRANNAGGLGITMANLTPYGGNGGNRPATGVTWYEAARLVNWLNTSAGHAPAYNLVGEVLQLWSTGEAWTLGGENLFRHKDAVYFLPSENEWYKAAYYSPGGVYYNYPTGSDTAPTAVAGGTGAGTAVYNGQSGPADIASAGGVSPYGTMGQGGNVMEWVEGALDGVNDLGTEARVARDGYWGGGASFIGSSYRNANNATLESVVLGFRVAAVPEPSESAGMIGLAALGFALWRRRGPF
jgi:formylglycine-generating enzyme required for sulfatase activity